MPELTCSQVRLIMWFMEISDKKVVRFDYTLKNGKGEVLDSSDGGEPLAYLHGAAQIVPGLEREMVGLSVGDSKSVVVAPEDGYGISDPEGIFGVPRAAFPPDMTPEVGQSFIGEDDEGHAVPVRIVELRDDTIMVDANHPLAGETLHFHVTVRDIRDATLEELTEGQVKA